MGVMKRLYGMSASQRRSALSGVRVEIKEFFFDRELVAETLDREGRKGLNRMGGYIRNVARSSIKRKGAARKPPKNKDGAAYQRWLAEQKSRPRSRPGDPVFQHSDHPIVAPKNILYGWDGDMSVVAGMVATWDGRPGEPIPHEIEFGSTSTGINLRRVVRKLGDGGEIAIVTGEAASTERRRNKQGRFVTGPQAPGKVALNTRLGNVLVRYAKLRTAAQVARANRLNEELYGPERIRTRTAPRPVMAPAFQKALDKFEPAFSGRLIG